MYIFVKMVGTLTDDRVVYIIATIVIASYLYYRWQFFEELWSEGFVFSEILNSQCGRHDDLARKRLRYS